MFQRSFSFPERGLDRSEIEVRHSISINRDDLEEEVDCEYSWTMPSSDVSYYDNINRERIRRKRASSGVFSSNYGEEENSGGIHTHMSAVIQKSSSGTQCSSLPSYSMRSAAMQWKEKEKVAKRSVRSSLTTPIPCPPKWKKNSESNMKRQELVEIYDYATWQMYWRIKNSRTTTSKSRQNFSRNDTI
eukprot:707015_1